MRLNFSILVALLFCINSCFAYNLKTSELSTIQKETQITNADTWVVFDIDGVLLESKDQILKTQYGPDYNELSGCYSYIIINNTANKLLGEELQRKVNTALASGLLTRNAYLYQYNVNSDTLYYWYIQTNGKVRSKIIRGIANDGESLADIISSLKMAASNEFKRLTIAEVKIIQAKSTPDIFTKIKEHSKLVKVKSPAEKQAKEQERLKKENTNSIIRLQAKETPVDNGMPGLIKKLQAKKIKVLALTLIRTGRYGKIPSVENLRIQQLKQSGYNFANSWSTVKDTLLDKFITNTLEPVSKGVIFSQGVIFTNKSAKGASLQAFLQYTHSKPKKIIFIDDHKANIDSVEAMAKKDGIEFVGIEYTAVKDKKIAPLNQERARLQLSVLEKEQRWLSDEEASKAL